MDEIWDLIESVYEGFLPTFRSQKKHICFPKSKLKYIYNVQLYLLMPNYSILAARGSCNNLLKMGRFPLILSEFFYMKLCLPKPVTCKNAFKEIQVCLVKNAKLP